MTRYLAIVVVNFVIALLIAVNAAWTMAKGYSGAAQYQPDAGSLALLGGALLAVLACVVVAVYIWRTRPRETVQRIVIPKAAQSERQPRGPEPDTVADASMSARLARMTTAAHVAPDEEPEAPEPEQEWTHAAAPEPAIAGSDAAQDDGAAAEEDPAPAAASQPAMDDTPAMDIALPTDFVRTASLPAEAAPLQSHNPEVDQQPVDSPESPIAAAHAPDNVWMPAGRRVVPLRFAEPEPEPEPEPEADVLRDWLFDDSIPGAPARLRAGSGFPWAVAGIDHMCIGVSRLGHRLVGTDYPAEAAAWRQVVSSLPRQQRLAGDDAAAFADWINGMIDVAGQDGADSVVDCIHELGAEAAIDPAVAASLPAELIAASMLHQPMVQTRFFK
jgi:hypothetical protein